MLFGFSSERVGEVVYPLAPSVGAVDVVAAGGVGVAGARYLGTVLAHAGLQALEGKEEEKRRIRVSVLCLRISYSGHEYRAQGGGLSPIIGNIIKRRKKPFTLIQRSKELPEVSKPFKGR